MDIDDSSDQVDPTVIVKGLFPLPKLLRFVRERCPPRCLDEAALIDEWRQARSVALGLFLDEADIADTVEIKPLPADMTSIAEQVMNQSSMRRSNSMATRSWRLVEIDRLIVFQDCINLRHARRLEASLPAMLDTEHVMHLASSTKPHTRPEVRFCQSDGEYTFSSKFNDLRFLDVTTVQPEEIANHGLFGTASHVLAIYLGFSENVISATRFGNRVVLTNGSHRAYVLRKRGWRYVPCLLTEASDADTSDILSPAAVKQDRNFYLQAPRPPLFKDYADPRLTRILPVTRRNYVLKAKLDLQRLAVPAL